MALGRKIGGRKKGSRNKRPRELIERIEASGLVPLEYMLAVTRDETAPPERRDDGKSRGAVRPSSFADNEGSGRQGCAAVQPIGAQRSRIALFAAYHPQGAASGRAGINNQPRQVEKPPGLGQGITVLSTSPWPAPGRRRRRLISSEITGA
jgi:hypothetical protein